MKKRIVTAFIATVMALAMTACGGNPSDGESSAESSTESTVESS